MRCDRRVGTESMAPPERGLTQNREEVGSVAADLEAVVEGQFGDHLFEGRVVVEGARVSVRPCNAFFDRIVDRGNCFFRRLQEVSVRELSVWSR